MDNKVGVRPSTTTGSLNIVVEKVVVDGEDIYYPRYKLATGPDGEATLVSLENALPVTLTASTTHETDSVSVLNEISRKLSILIKYESMLHKIDLEEL